MPAEIDENPSWPAARAAGDVRGRIVAAGGSLAVTATVLVLLNAGHPPTGATTLIVSLGLLHTPPQLIGVFAAVLLVTVVDLLVNRAGGGQMPSWAAPKEG